MQVARGTDRAKGIVLVGHRRTEEGEHPFGRGGLEHAAVALDNLAGSLEQPILARLGDLGVAILLAVRRPRGQHRDDLAGLVRRHRLGRGRRRERRILGEHGALQLLELRAGLDPELLDELRPRALVDVERVGLAPAAVEGHHQLPAQALA